MRSRKQKPKPKSIEPRSLDFNGFSVGRLFSVLDTFNLGVGVYDRELRYEAVNSVLAEIHNLPQNEHRGKTVYEVLGPLGGAVASNLDRVFTTGQPRANIHIVGELPRRREAAHWFAYYFPLTDSRRRVTRAVAFVMELNLRPRSQAAAGAAPSTRPSPSQTNAAVLSRRELDILRSLALGKSNKEISSTLGISVKTVEAHRSRLMLKINASSLVYLVHYAIRHHIVEPQG